MNNSIFLTCSLSGSKTMTLEMCVDRISSWETSSFFAIWYLSWNYDVLAVLSWTAMIYHMGGKDTFFLSHVVLLRFARNFKCGGLCPPSPVTGLGESSCMAVKWIIRNRIIQLLQECSIGSLNYFDTFEFLKLISLREQLVFEHLPIKKLKCS